MVFTVNAKGEKNKELTRRGERINGNYWNVKGSAENFQFRFLNSQIHTRRFSRENSKSVCVRERLTWRQSICIRASILYLYLVRPLHLYPCWGTGTGPDHRFPLHLSIISTCLPISKYAPQNFQHTHTPTSMVCHKFHTKASGFSNFEKASKKHFWRVWNCRSSFLHSESKSEKRESESENLVSERYKRKCWEKRAGLS